MVVHRPPWSCVVRHGCASSAMVVHRPPWSCIVRHGRASSAMVVHQLPWYVVRPCMLSPVLLRPPFWSFRRCASSAVVVYCASSTIIRRLFIVVCPWLPIVHWLSLCRPSPVVGRWSQIRSALSLEHVDHPSVDHPTI